MTNITRGFLLLGTIAVLLITACSGEFKPEAAAAQVTPEAAKADAEPSPSGVITASSTPVPPTSSPAATITPVHAVTAQATASSALPAAVTPCPPDLCVIPGQFFLQRPIPETGNTAVDVTYRFGSTQGGKRDPHHGVEFLNGFGTAVLAAGDGTVVVAGIDIDPTSPPGVWPIEYYGPYSNFYGNLVVVEHRVPEDLRLLVPDYAPVVYTLYGHLSEILVEQGEQVQAGQEIGKVGVSGVSTGSHLHFEVRAGENKYANSRNPELWLAPGRGKDGSINGGIAGRVIDPYGENTPVSNIVLEYLPEGVDGKSDSELYLLSYEEQGLIGQEPFRESFAVGDIPAGLYRISFPLFGRQEFIVEVFPGQVTLVAFKIDG